MSHKARNWATILVFLGWPALAHATKDLDAARGLLKDGPTAAAVASYSRIALGHSASAGLVSECALALAIAGQADSALSQLDRAFSLDSQDAEVLYCASQIRRFWPVANSPPLFSMLPQYGISGPVKCNGLAEALLTGHASRRSRIDLR